MRRLPPALLVLARRGGPLTVEGEIRSLKKTQNKKSLPPADSSEGYARRAEAFSKTFTSDEAQSEAIRRYSVNAPYLKSVGPTAKAFAIDRWWQDELENSRA